MLEAISYVEVFKNVRYFDRVLAEQNTAPKIVPRDNHPKAYARQWEGCISYVETRTILTGHWFENG